ncbi:MAG TPA: hypothetical protein VNM92_12060 [Thermoanaerobaculia bacterium]|nr:hypothetical protein [Thermoanaerobaculia bacterium]
MSLFRKAGNRFKYGSMASAALLSGVMMFSTLASAQTGAAAAFLSPTGLNRWTTSGPEGGSVTSLVTDPVDNLVYAGTSGGVFLRTSAGWTAVSDGLPDVAITALAVVPSAPSSLYAGTSRGRVFRSTNRGQSWTEIQKPVSGSVRSFAVDITRQRIYVATTSGVFVSQEEGQPWRNVPELVGDALSIAVSPNGVVYALMFDRGKGRSLSVSTDGGASWSSATLPTQSVGALTGNPLNSTIYIVGDRPIVYASDDNGKTWRALPVLGVILVPGQAPILTLLSDGSRLFAGTSDGLYVLESGASSWQRVGTLTASVRAVTITSQRPQVIYAGSILTFRSFTNGVFQKTDDAASDWKQDNLGLTAVPVIDLAVTGDLEAHAATSAGFFQTKQGGLSWQKSAQVVEPVTSIAANRQSVYLADEKGIERSGDGGQTWEIVTPRKATHLAVSKGSPETVYANLSYVLSKSSDGGRSWKPAEVGLPRDFYYGPPGYVYTRVLETDGEAPAVAYVATPDGLFVTNDAGESWQSLLTQTYAEDIRAVAARGLIIHTALTPYSSSQFGERPRGIITSLDGGKSWSDPRLRDESVQTIAIDPVTPSRSYAGTESGRVYRSEDFGKEWILFSEGLRLASVRRLEISDSGKRIYAATDGGVFVYEIGSTLLFQRLPDDSARLPRLLRQLSTAGRNLACTSCLGPGFVLPAVGTVQGSGGAVFKTDVTLTNSRATEQGVTLMWLPRGNPSGSAVQTFRITLPPSSEDGGGSLTLSDIASELGLQGFGSLVVVATTETGELDNAAYIDGFARVRSPSLCGPGSVSQSLPAVSSQAFGLQRRARALGLVHEPGSRTNVGIVNLDGVSREFTVLVNGQRASERLSVSVPPFASVQTAVPDRNYGALTVTVVSSGGASGWVAYAVSVDNASGDSWASIATPLPDR